MDQTLKCPSCGVENPADRESCSNCNFPLRDAVPAPPARGKASPAPDPPVVVRRPERRPRRTIGPAMDPMSRNLWIWVGGLCALGLVWYAWQFNQDARKSAQPEVAGANQEQQQQVDQLRAMVRQDTTNINARQALGNLYYDTGNWPDAIVEYRAVLRVDSTRVEAIVDMGVCYFNLGDMRTAEQLFRTALDLDPQQPIALFNMGVVSESRGELEQALHYFHEAVKVPHPPSMQEPLVQAVTRIQQKLGRTPPPLAPGAGGAPPSGMPPGGTPPAK